MAQTPQYPYESSLTPRNDKTYLGYGTSVRGNKTRFSSRKESAHSLHTRQRSKESAKSHFANLKVSLQDVLKAAQKEQFVLKVSMFSALILAIFGIGFGIYVKSMAVIFDGFVALISVGLGALSVVTSRYIYKEDDDIFQYGYVRFEPMVNLFKSLVLVFVCVYAFINAIQSIVNGGYEVELGGAVLYSLCAFAFCGVLFVYTLLYTRILESDLIKVDNTEWKIDCVLYLGALVAFGAIYMLPHFGFDTHSSTFARYIDPALLAILSLLLCVSPVRIAIANFKDLVMVAPPEIDEKITQIMESLSAEFGFSDYDTHVAKSGRFYMVEVNILTHEHFKPVSMQEFDSIRERIEKALEIPSYKIWLSVSWTANPKWL
ncbi:MULTISPECIES: cation diffusion facilitator family transporter [Helicobacter]|uniref:Cation transporter n=1 Tax=Helicobacter typhlonius TaxID=76936 RepID=A0A0S4PZT8_9HELI|nr:MULTISPECIES: cation transporter [Helicobacter]TLD78916.1 cation transporter [Helicobacter typhlonius]TLD90249.1 cation transporter [Helicobacter sp. MIT 03-1616]CUU40932.1 Cobalt-zinc-cadmium resistance protein [Helicobacter typhlonius]